MELRGNWGLLCFWKTKDGVFIIFVPLIGGLPEVLTCNNDCLWLSRPRIFVRYHKNHDIYMVGCTSIQCFCMEGCKFFLAKILLCGVRIQLMYRQFLDILTHLIMWRVWALQVASMLYIHWFHSVVARISGLRYETCAVFSIDASILAGRHIQCHFVLFVRHGV